MYVLSLIMASAAGAFYHISQKNIPAKLEPALSLIITFSVALMGSILWYFLRGGNATFTADIKNINWASFTMGLSIIGLEAGIMLAYRSGWQISSFNLFYTFLLTIILLPVGILFFKETVSMKYVLGIAVTVGGIILMKA